MNNVKTWVTGESDAEIYLENKGYKILERNYETPVGELDLICFDPIERQKTELNKKLSSGEISDRVYERFLKQITNVLVFVEVKTRETAKFGDALYAINKAKQRKVSQSALIYMKQNKMLDFPARFDCVGITAGKITHIENAFELSL